MNTLDLATVPGVLALVEIFKRVGLPAAWSPLAAIVCGVLITIGMNGVSTDFIIQGFVLGLSASGLWSGSKATLGALKK